MIKEEIIKQIKPDFEQIIKYNYPDVAEFLTVDSTKTLEQWAKAKEDFYEMFGEKLIYEIGDVKFHLTDETKMDKLSKFISKIHHTYNFPDLADFIKAFREDFFETQVTSSVYIRDFNNSIPKGMKIIKAFKYFIDDENLLHVLQNQASQLIQEDKVTGTLCMSIHPLDYLSVSENTYNWRSCHALDGDYCAGNLSYMCDRSTIVCYIRGKDEKELPHFGGVKWNSKKWRMLFFVNSNGSCVFAGRHYPFFCYEAMDKILDTYRYDFPGTEVKFSNWHDDYSDNYTFKKYDRLYGTGMDLDEHIFMNNYVIRLQDVVYDMCSLHFDDLLGSSVYRPYYAWTQFWTPNSPLSVGAHPVCPACGNERLISSEELVCNSCSYWAEQEKHNKEISLIGQCSCCDRDIYEGDEFGEADGNLLCNACLESHTKTCASCGKIFTTDYMNPVFNEQTQEYRYYCTNCMEERIENNG